MALITPFSFRDTRHEAIHYQIQMKRLALLAAVLLAGCGVLKNKANWWFCAFCGGVESEQQSGESPRLLEEPAPGDRPKGSPSLDDG